MNSINLPKVNWCKNCVYPSSSAVTLTFNNDGVCSGCIVNAQKKNVNWEDRLKLLLQDVEKYRKPSGYECIIPVSGGKDSYYQVHFVKEKLNLNPLLVTYNGNNYLDTGWTNLMNMKKVFKCDHIILSPNEDMLIRLNRLGFTKTGDMNWQNHCGIMTSPIQAAVKYEIPLMFWGEHGWTELGGMHSINDFPEFTYRYRVDQQLRGYDWWDFIKDKEEKIHENEMELFKYPSDEKIQKVGVRGIHLGFFDPWDANVHTKLVMDKYNWKPSPVAFERTYRRMSNLDDKYENGVHDYMKWIKFGYGRATDHASKDIRNGAMTRDEGVAMVKKYDHVYPSDTDFWLNYVDRDKEWFWQVANKFRSPFVWSLENNNWNKRNIWDKNESK